MKAHAGTPLSERMNALVPKSLFGQFFGAVIVAVVLSTLVGISINAWVARGLLYEMQSEVGNAELRAVVELLVEKRIGAVMVVARDGGNLVGVVSAVDVLQAVRDRV